MYTAQFGKRLTKSYTLREVVAGNMTFDAWAWGSYIPDRQKRHWKLQKYFTLLQPVHIRNEHYDIPRTCNSKEAIDQVSQYLQEQKCSDTRLIQSTITALVQNLSMTDMYPPLLKSLVIKTHVPIHAAFHAHKNVPPICPNALTPAAPTD